MVFGFLNLVLILDLGFERNWIRSGVLGSRCLDNVKVEGRGGGVGGLVVFFVR